MICISVSSIIVMSQCAIVPGCVTTYADCLSEVHHPSAIRPPLTVLCPALLTEVDCGSPERPDEKLSVSTSGQQVGDTATYSCEPGHNLVGATARTCLATGGWSGAPPRCQGEWRAVGDEAELGE